MESRERREHLRQNPLEAFLLPSATDVVPQSVKDSASARDIPTGDGSHCHVEGRLILVHGSKIRHGVHDSSSAPARPRLRHRVLLACCLLPHERARPPASRCHGARLRRVASASGVSVAPLEALPPASASRPPGSVCRCSPPDPPTRPSPRAAGPGSESAIGESGSAP